MVNKVAKICGLKDQEAARVAIDSGANLVGVILVPGRKRTVDADQAMQIAQLCQDRRQKLDRVHQTSKELLKIARESKLTGSNWFDYCAQLIIENGPFLVGVFRNQSLKEVIEISHRLNLDFVQLHGSEDIEEYASAIDLPVIARFVLQSDNIELAVETHRHFLTLLDSEVGGEGHLINWTNASEFYSKLDGRFILAGGLTPENVGRAVNVDGCVGVDVSGGVETQGVKDPKKIQRFLTIVKNII
ncbi:hypothetical protein FOA43_001120 [Brettanomyces nanus]|uniref:N-(5'-phosphoribosyl)anthranilate isomerase n=1 Tax=Eeniella nana TaxID=13502 RepID=A0A875RXL6_EENNA|nr:uncharacterized protein FOA43_001120 [Brettanomyces nanus]QPG73806.1 hypothetical protein FOA43_001120 [Brettanomyces nanus]